MPTPNLPRGVSMGSTRTTWPAHRHSVVGLPLISSGIFRRISTADPIARGSSVAKKVPLSERFCDSALRSVEPDFQTRTRRAVFKRWRGEIRCPDTYTCIDASLHQGGTMAQAVICPE